MDHEENQMNPASEEGRKEEKAKQEKKLEVLE
jgi:hypothetical protein